MRNEAARQKQRGAVTLEFAFGLLLVIFPLMFGIVDFSRAAYDYHWVSDAARNATRWASVRGASCTLLTGGCPASSSDVQTYVSGLVVYGMDPANVTSTTTWTGKGGDGTDCTNGGNQTNKSAGCIVQVQVNYSFTFSFPFMENLGGVTKVMHATSQMVISQ
jgi:Flp pilus assembly protein TadG